VHLLSRSAPKCLHHWNLVPDYIWIIFPFSIFDQIGQEEVQSIDSDKLLREIKRRAEVIDSAVYVVWIGEVPDILLPDPELELGKPRIILINVAP